MKNLLGVIIVFWLCTVGLNAQEYESYKKALDTSLHSKSLGFEKNISVILPLEWQSDLSREFPVIIIFDKQNQRSHNYIINTIDYLTSNDQMPSSIIISVESNQQYRYLETVHKNSNEKALANENEKFIFDELFPLAENQFKASNFRILIGHSRYGYFTSSLLFSRINELNAIISLSPFFSQKNVELTDSIKLLSKMELNTHKYYRFGIGNDYPKDFYTMDSVLNIINNPLFNSKGVLHKEAGHNVTPGLSIATSLYEIFEEWSKFQNKYFSNDYDQLDNFPKIEKEVTDHYGSELKFSLGVLNGKGWFFYNLEEYEKAIQAWEIQLKAYPNFSLTHIFILDAKKMINKDLSKEEIENMLNKFKKSLDNSTFFNAKEKQELLKEVENEYK